MNAATPARDIPAGVDVYCVRLLRSYCNRERATAHLEKLRAQAGAEDVLRTETPTPVRPSAPKRLSNAVNAGIVFDYQAGLTAREIAAKYGTTDWTVRHRLHRAGVDLRPSSMSDEQVAFTHRLRAGGMTLQGIADRVGFSEATVRNALKRHAPQAS